MNAYAPITSETLDEMMARHRAELSAFVDADVADTWEKVAPPRHGARMDDILESVCRATGYTPEALRGRARDYRTSRARQVAMWHLHQHGFGHKAIAKFFGRDHTTALHGIRRIEGLRHG